MIARHAVMTAATATRVLRQLRADPQTIGMIVAIPVVLLTLVYFMFDAIPAVPGQRSRFDVYGLPMLGILPFIAMFLVTSIAMLRERSTGTLERLLTTPLSRLDLITGYAVGFALAATAQALVIWAFSIWVLGMTVTGPVGYVLLIAILTAVLGVGLGLLCSAFARTEFQAVQFLPAVVIPQLFVCGLFVPVEQLPGWLQVVSEIMPLTYAVDALTQIAEHPGATGRMWWDLAIVVAWTVAALAVGAGTLHRRTA